MKIPAFKKEHISLARDASLSLTCIAGMGALMFTAGFTTFSNLMNSGNLTFIDFPLLTASLSILPAVGTFAVKAPVNLLDEKYRKPYTLLITGLSILCLLVWCCIFAISFHNNTGEMPDIAALEEGVDSFTTIAYTVTQLMSEMLVASTLFIYLENICSKYISDVLVDNPAYLAAAKDYDAAKAELKALTTELSQKQGRLNALLSLRKAYIAEQMATYLHLASHL